MPVFPKPDFPYAVNLNKELTALRAHKEKEDRKIPTKTNNKLLLATWNIANLGAQKRDEVHYKLIAEIISWFDIIAIQETRDNLEGIRGIHQFLPSDYKLIFTDKGGNDERMTIIYDSKKLTLQEKIAELALSPSEYNSITLDGLTTKFDGFDRSPYIASFKVNNFLFLLVNVHLYYGDDSEKKSLERRALETYAVARWAYNRRMDKDRYTDNIIALGDFNLPKKDPDDSIYKALTAKGLILPEHRTKIHTNIVDTNDYDQIAFFPGLKNQLTGNSGVYDYDTVIFSDLWDPQKPGNFRSYCRYYISDHRPLWLELAI